MAKISKMQAWEFFKKLDEDSIVKIYNEYKDKVKKNTVQISTHSIPKDSPKYITALKFFNSLLKKMDRDEIDDLTKFENIDRSDIIKNNEVFKTHENELFSVFNKAKCAWYRRNSTKRYILTVCRYICKDLGFIFKMKKFNTSKNGRMITKYLYSIK